MKTMKNNKIVKEWIYKGFICRVVRIRYLGHLCGYVLLPKNHRLFEKEYFCEELEDLDVHGGITYSDYSEDKKYWVIGFDCAHFGDFDPASVLSFRYKPSNLKKIINGMEEADFINLWKNSGSEDHYWTVPEVIKETERLVDQI